MICIEQTVAMRGSEMNLMEFGNPRGITDAEAVSFVKQGVGKDDCSLAEEVSA